MNVFVVILHYGSIELTKECIKSMLKNDNNFKKIVLVNNDKNITLISSFFHLSDKKLHIINNRKNHGFSGGVNMGIKYALKKNMDAVMILNNDTLIERGFLKKLVAVFDSDEVIGIVSPAIKFSRNGKNVFDIGGRINKFFFRTTHNEVFSIKNLHLRDVDYVTGAAMLIKNEVFRKIGYFDEKFFLYYEDVDFCLRAREKGFQVVVEPEAIIFHSLSKTVGKVSSFAVYYQIRSAVIFGRKHIRHLSGKLFHIVFLTCQSAFITLKYPNVGAAAFKAFFNLPL